MNDKLDRIDALLEELHATVTDCALIDDEEQAKVTKFCTWLSHRVHLARQAEDDHRIKAYQLRHGLTWAQVERLYFAGIADSQPADTGGDGK
jgi:hypothetical protein